MNVFSHSRILRIIVTLILITVICAASALVWLSRNLTSLVEQALRRTYGPDLSLGEVESGWNRVVLRDIRLKCPGAGPIADRISIGEVIMTPRLTALLSRRIEIGLLRMRNPRVLIEIAPDGSVISPLTARSGAAAVGPTGTSRLSLNIKRIEMVEGEMVFLDRSVDRLKRPGVNHRRDGFHLFRLTDIKFTSGPVAVPHRAAAVPVALRLAAPGPGSLDVSGTFNPATLDSALKITLRHWDLTKFRPYYLKPDDLDVVHGYLDGDATVTIAARKLHAPGEIRIKGLEVRQSERQSVFLGMSATAFLSMTKDSRGEIDTAFLLSGDLANPRFKVQQSLVEQIGNGLARKLGVPILSEVGSGIINLGKKGISGIRSLFDGRK